MCLDWQTLSENALSHTDHAFGWAIAVRKYAWAHKKRVWICRRRTKCARRCGSTVWHIMIPKRFEMIWGYAFRCLGARRCKKHSNYRTTGCDPNKTQLKTNARQPSLTKHNENEECSKWGLNMMRRIYRLLLKLLSSLSRSWSSHFEPTYTCQKH